MGRVPEQAPPGQRSRDQGGTDWHWARRRRGVYGDERRTIRSGGHESRNAEGQSRQGVRDRQTRDGPRSGGGTRSWRAIERGGWLRGRVEREGHGGRTGEDLGDEERPAAVERHAVRSEPTIGRRRPVLRRRKRQGSGRGVVCTGPRHGHARAASGCRRARRGTEAEKLQAARALLSGRPGQRRLFAMATRAWGSRQRARSRMGRARGAGPQRPANDSAPLLGAGRIPLPDGRRCQAAGARRGGSGSTIACHSRGPCGRAGARRVATHAARRRARAGDDRCASRSGCSAEGARACGAASEMPWAPNCPPCGR